jgi:hypothetical protein
MKKEKTIGLLLIAGAIGVLIPYTILTITFEYPGILRQHTGTLLYSSGWKAFAYI